MIWFNLGARTQEEETREESRDDTPQFKKRKIINKKKKWGKTTTRWCQRNFSEKGIRDRESSINQDTFFKFIARNNEKLAWKEIQLQNHLRNYSFLSQNNLEWMLTNDISIKTCLEKTKSMEKRHRRKMLTTKSRRHLNILYERNIQALSNRKLDIAIWGWIMPECNQQTKNKKLMYQSRNSAMQRKSKNETRRRCPPMFIAILIF